MSTSRQYELVYIVTPEATEQEIADLHTQIEQIVQRYQRHARQDRELGPRKRSPTTSVITAKGNYVVETITGSGELMKEIDRRLRVIDRSSGTSSSASTRSCAWRSGRTDARKKFVARRRVARGLPPERQPGEGRRRRRFAGRHGRVGGPAMREERGRPWRPRRGQEGRTRKARTRRAAGSSAAAACASSARRRSTTSTTRTCGCWRRSCRSAARFSRGGFPARARMHQRKLQDGDQARAAARADSVRHGLVS